jgi:hypothetical protein
LGYILVEPHLALAPRGVLFIMRGFVAEFLILIPLLILVAGGMYAQNIRKKSAMSNIIDLDESKVHLLDERMAELDLSVPAQYDDV